MISREGLAFLQERINDLEQEDRRVSDVLTQLEIPHSGDTVSAKELVAILMDEEKVKNILTMVRNKLFW